MATTWTLNIDSRIDDGRDADLKLVERARQGDAQSFRRLVERHESAVAATVNGMLGRGEDAEDVGQEVFVRFFRSLDRFRGEARVRTYLTRIAINLSLNALHKRKKMMAREHHADSEEALGYSTETETAIDSADRATLVRKAIRSLDPPFRAVVVLRVMEGYSTRETAELLSIPVGTVLSRLARAQKKLKTILSPYFEDDEA